MNGDIRIANFSKNLYLFAGRKSVCCGWMQKKIADFIDIKRLIVLRQSKQDSTFICLHVAD